MSFCNANAASSALIAQEGNNYHLVFERVKSALSKQRFLKEVFDECVRRMETEFDSPFALYTAHTLSISKDAATTLYEEYKELIERYMALPTPDQHELEIFQVCTQAIPLTKRSIGQRSEPRVFSDQNNADLRRGNR